MFSLTTVYLLMSMEGEVKIFDFSLSRRESDPMVLSNGSECSINTRWSAPEVLKTAVASKANDVW